MTEIILNGCNGKMGMAVSRLVAERDDCTIVAGVDINTDITRDFPVFSSIKDVKKGDVIIDFSHPSCLSDLLEYAVSTKTPIVVATTGLSDADIENVKAASKAVPVFFTFNMSLGINLLVELAKTASKVLGDRFDIEIIEKHHNQKIDAPSGTAIMLANGINEVNDGKYVYEYNRQAKREKRDAREIGIHAIRGGNIVGEHEVIFAGHDEVISLSHSAGSKEVFAAGAVNAAVFISDVKPGLYDMKNLIASI
ncbi:MAG: 4-hydroxy-tetrahydrodipicolinate reductase [Clostridia bacterium]|nr:4-hydroxy-tetrahydrodipicolinate reductase [Clostridia bacterium]